LQPAASLIISFYNKIEYLKLILAAVERQTFKNFEVIVADDGSKEDIVYQVKRLLSELPFQAKHIWHEDSGFRKNTMLNKAIQQSNSDYLIFIDGDCVPHCRFVEEHVSNANSKIVLAGRRVNLSQRLTAKLTPDGIKKGFLESVFTLQIIFDGVFGGSTQTLKGIYAPRGFVRTFLNRTTRGILGCNFSIHKQDLVDINGFDERYQSPGIGEDTDIEVRLLRNNVEVRMVKNMAIQYHLFHKRLNRGSDNLKIFEEVLNTNVIITPYGLIKPEDV